ncbi:hypothetical protein ABLB90_14830 [Photorhabdus bodei]|uniref:hypothetical protein n=1 Tax=Photorhabdus bodei TaxID=2029681 RepID=UPI0032B72AAB
MTAHVHAKNMALYAQDALKTDEPWLMWERFYIEAIGWEQCPHNPGWNPEFKYRRKPEMITFGTVSFPKPVNYRLKDGDRYFAIITLDDIDALYWYSDADDYFYLQAGIIHLTEEAAKQHVEALIRINNGEF